MHKKHLFVSALVLLLSLGFFTPMVAAEAEEYDKKKGYEAAPLHLVSSFEDLLHRQERLLFSFESILDGYRVPPEDVMKSFEDLLRRQAKLLDSFEDVAKPYACGHRIELKVVASFEALLKGQAKLLAKFEAQLHKMPHIKIFFIESFEDLLRRQANLLLTFEDMLHCLDENHYVSPKQLLPFLKSFESLIRSQANLLMSFETLVKGTVGYERKDDHYAEKKHDDYEEKDDHYDKYEEEKPKKDHYEKKDDYKEKDHYEEPKKDHYEKKSDDYRDDHKGSKKDDHYGYDAHGYGTELPNLHKIVDFAKHGREAMKYHKMREMLHARKELTEHFVGMIHAYKEHVKELHHYGDSKKAYYMLDQLAEFRYKVSKLQGKLVQQSLEVTLAPKYHSSGHDYEYEYHDKYGDDDHYGYHHEVKLIVTNKGPFTIDMASFAVFHGYEVVFRKSLGTLEPGEHKVLKIKVSDPYKAKLILEHSVTTGFINMFSKIFQAAMTKH